MSDKDFFGMYDIPGGGGGGACMSVMYRCVNKKDEKGYFFELGSAQRCHHFG